MLYLIAGVTILVLLILYQLIILQIKMNKLLILLAPFGRFNIQNKEVEVRRSEIPEGQKNNRQ